MSFVPDYSHLPEDPPEPSVEAPRPHPAPAAILAGPSRWRWTSERWHQAGEAGIFGPEERLELIEGEIVVMSPIGRRHSGRVSRATKQLILLLQDEATVLSQQPIAIGENSEPIPDLGIYNYREDFYEASNATPADCRLLIEFSETSLRFDLGPKAVLFARALVPEYWVVDLQNRVVIAHRGPLATGQWTSVIRHSVGERIVSERLPKVSFSVDELTGVE